MDECNSPVACRTTIGIPNQGMEECDTAQRLAKLDLWNSNQSMEESVDGRGIPEREYFSWVHEASVTGMCFVVAIVSETMV